MQEQVASPSKTRLDWPEFKRRAKKAWKEYLRRNIIIFVCVFSILILVDMLSKGLIYDGNKTQLTGETQANWGFLGFRSQFHTSTTFLDFIGATLPHWASLLINYALVAIFVFLVALSRNKWRTAALSVIFAGIIGNTVDATYFGGVRNVLFIPYNDHGTFNFADFFIFLGAALVVLTFFAELATMYLKKRKARLNQQVLSNVDVTSESSEKGPSNST